MIYFKEILGFYQRPLQTTRELLSNKDLKWIYPTLIYLICFGFAFIPVIVVKLINSKIDIYPTLFYVPLLTLPFIMILTMTGRILFKKFNNSLLYHLYASTLLVSYNFFISLLLIICAIALNYLGFLLSPMAVAVIYVLSVLYSKVIFNLKIYNLQKKRIWVNSIIEILLTLILSVTIIGGVATIINAP